MDVRVTKNDFANLARLGEERARQARQAVARTIEGDYKAGVPVDTGALRNSITVAEDGPDTSVIYSPMEYAPHVEFGHATRSGTQVAGVPALTQAAERARTDFERALRDLFKG